MSEHNFTKKDFFGAWFAGMLIALLILPIAKNISLWETFVGYINDKFISVFLAAWFVVFPFLIVGGLIIIHRLALKFHASIFEVGKYGIVGIANTFLSAGIFNLLMLLTGISIGWPVVAFIIIASVFTITHSFFWNKFWIFKANNTNRGKIEYVYFLIISVGVLLLNAGLIHIIVNIIGAPKTVDTKIWANIAFLFLIPVSFLGNFFGYKMIVFKERREEV